MRRTSSIGVVGACSLLVLVMSAASASAQTQTAQSAMVALTPDSAAYEIAGTITWTFNRGNHNDVDLTGTAMSYYTNAWDGAAPTVTCNGGGANGCVYCACHPRRAGAAVARVTAAGTERSVHLFLRGHSRDRHVYASRHRERKLRGQRKKATGSSPTPTRSRRRRRSPRRPRGPLR